MRSIWLSHSLYMTYWFPPSPSIHLPIHLRVHSKTRTKHMQTRALWRTRTRACCMNTRGSLVCRYSIACPWQPRIPNTYGFRDHYPPYKHSDRSYHPHQLLLPLTVDYLSNYTSLPFPSLPIINYPDMLPYLTIKMHHHQLTHLSNTSKCTGQQKTNPTGQNQA